MQLNSAMEKDYTAAFEQTIHRYSPASKSTVETMIDCGSFELYKKNDLVFSEKKFNAFEYFQLQGISHRFNIDAENQVITTGIYTDQTVITPYFARTINSQSIFSLQTLTDCVFFKIPIGAFEEIRLSNEQVRAFGQRVVEKEFIRSLNYEVLFRSHTAKERLLFFRSHYPSLENLIPHSVIASFLGITPVSFSRLRNELTKEN